MNRITKLIHQANFFWRQRKTVGFFKKYVLNSDDIAKMEGKTKRKRKVKPKISETAPDLIDKLLLDFDPETIDIDRRIY